MQLQFLSEKMCRLLSSLVSGFEGHWVYYRNKNDEINVVCKNSVIRCYDSRTYQFICPAWQVEDVLRNFNKIRLEICAKFGVFGHRRIKSLSDSIFNTIAEAIMNTPDIAYQKIEEYLWTILK